MNSDKLEKLFRTYGEYKEEKIKRRRIKHSELEEIILAKKNFFEIENLGSSVQGRKIYSIKCGGGRKILMWSQMHGDEPTATLALLDLMNFLEHPGEFGDLRDSIINNVEIIIVPMLNPDGAENVTRHNALGIDINRDAKELSSPESKILMKLLEEIEPEFAFNLHDQDIRWSVGSTNQPASVSLLAPPPDYAKTINRSRLKAMKLISLLHEKLSLFTPGRIAKFGDDHEPRSFGDTAAALGFSTVLIETGREKNDPEKDNLRRLNFIAFVTALEAAAAGSYEEYSSKGYNSIPFNGKLYHDLIIRGAQINRGGSLYSVDIGIDRDEFYDRTSGLTYIKSKISAIGDLSHTFGFEEVNAEGKIIATPGVHIIGNKQSLNYNYEEIFNIIKTGSLFIHSADFKGAFFDAPINIARSKLARFNFVPDEGANFILKDTQSSAYVINGFYVEKLSDLDKVANGIAE